MTPKRSTHRKTTAGRALYCAKLRILIYCAWNYLCPSDLCRCARKKVGRSHKSVYFTSAWSDLWRADSNQTCQVCSSRRLRQTFQVSSLEIEMFRCSEALQFPCCHSEYIQFALSTLLYALYTAQQVLMIAHELPASNQPNLPGTHPRALSLGFSIE